MVLDVEHGATGVIDMSFCLIAVALGNKLMPYNKLD